MLHFAYDGSINGNWTAQYALRLAAASTSRALRLLHVQDPLLGDEALQDALAHVKLRAQRLGVELELELLPHTRNVTRALLGRVPPGAEELLITGTRVREGSHGYLTGTVSERLLRAGHCSVMALRVVQPGLLGLPHRLLLPLAGNPASVVSPHPFLQLMAPQITALALLRVREVYRWRFRMITREAGRRLLEPERAWLRGMEEQLVRQLNLDPALVDAQAVLSDDVPKEIVIAAGRSRTHLILLGVSRRNLRERFVWGNPIEQVLRNAPCDVAITSTPTP